MALLFVALFFVCVFLHVDLFFSEEVQGLEP